MTKDKRIQEIDQQISELRAERNELSKALDKEFLKEAKNNVGRCFFNAATNIYVKVVDVPRIIETMTGSDLNKYQYPAIFIGENFDSKDSISPFYEDTLFSGAWGIGYDPLESWEEISSHIFDKKFQEVMSEFQSYVLNVKSLKEANT